jgi:hypothetical protein
MDNKQKRAKLYLQRAILEECKSTSVITQLQLLFALVLHRIHELFAPSIRGYIGAS